MKLLMSFLAIGLICVDGSEKVSGNFMYFVCPSVVSRSEWNASAATEINFLEHPVKIAIICHTATPECSSLATCKRRVKRIQRYHQREKLWGDIAYNFLIGGDGNVYEGIGWNQSGRHTKNFNDISVGIAFIGNFTAADGTSSWIGVGSSSLGGIVNECASKRFSSAGGEVMEERKGEKDIPGLTDTQVPCRLSPRRASRIRKVYHLSKEDDVHLYVVCRQPFAKEGKKPRTKAPKIQRLITPSCCSARDIASR